MSSKKKTSIRTRILSTILGLIAFIFLLFILVFNLFMSDYIQGIVRQELSQIQQHIDKEQSLLQRDPPPPPTWPNSQQNFPGPPPDVRKIPRTPMSKADLMIISENYTMIFPSSEMTFARNYQEVSDILQELQKNQNSLDSKEMMRIKAQGREYYFVSFKITSRDYENPVYFLYYIDMSSLLSFSHRINQTLLLIMAVVALLAITLAFFLSGLIARPIKELTQFAIRLGKNDYSTNPSNYKDQELSDLAESMNKSAKQLETYDKEQRTFFQNVSHELRTPLQSITSNAEGIQCKILDPSTSSEIILQESNRLNELVDDLLYSSYIESTFNAMNPQAYDLRELLSSCAERQRNTATLHHIHLSFDFDPTPVMMECDEKRLSRAFSNLISNALRHARSSITLSCKKDAHHITLTFSNDGEGISETDLPHLFTRFYKGVRGHHGIGLALSKTIIEQHQGTIKALNTPQGASFILQFSA